MCKWCEVKDMFDIRDKVYVEYLVCFVDNYDFYV